MSLYHCMICDAIHDSDDGHSIQWKTGMACGRCREELPACEFCGDTIPHVGTEYQTLTKSGIKPLCKICGAEDRERREKDRVFRARLGIF